jgi:hypothetical protein
VAQAAAPQDVFAAVAAEAGRLLERRSGSFQAASW